MGTSSRYYLFPEGAEPLKLSRRLVDGLVHGNDALPQYASSRQKILSALVEMDGQKPIEIQKTDGSIWVFDEDGTIYANLQATLFERMRVFDSLRAEGTVVALAPRLSKQKLDREYSWEPGGADIDKIIADIWPKQKSDRLKSAEGVSKRRPPLSYDAKHALDEISGDFWKISHAIGRLKEPSQKGFGFEARERSRTEPEYSALYRALAEMSDWHLEVDRRRRTGKGAWYAMVEIMVARDGIREAAERYYERCESRDKAVLATRRLLAEHAAKFSDYVTVEAEMITDLEWEQRAYPD